MHPCPQYGTRKCTFAATAKDEFSLWLQADFPDTAPVPLEETKVDCNVMPYRDPGLRRAPKMPEFDVTNDDGLRGLWRICPATP